MCPMWWRWRVRFGMLSSSTPIFPIGTSNRWLVWEWRFPRRRDSTEIYPIGSFPPWLTCTIHFISRVRIPSRSAIKTYPNGKLAKSHPWSLHLWRRPFLPAICPSGKCQTWQRSAECSSELWHSTVSCPNGSLCPQRIFTKCSMKPNHSIPI